MKKSNMDKVRSQFVKPGIPAMAGGQKKAVSSLPQGSPAVKAQASAGANANIGSASDTI